MRCARGGTAQLSYRGRPNLHSPTPSSPQASRWPARPGPPLRSSLLPIARPLGRTLLFLFVFLAVCGCAELVFVQQHSLHHDFLHEEVHPCGLTDLQDNGLVHAEELIPPGLLVHLCNHLVHLTVGPRVLQERLHALLLANAGLEALGGAQLLQLRGCLLLELSPLLLQHLAHLELPTLRRLPYLGFMREQGVDHGLLLASRQAPTGEPLLEFLDVHRLELCLPGRRLVLLHTDGECGLDEVLLVASHLLAFGCEELLELPHGHGPELFPLARSGILLLLLLLPLPLAIGLVCEKCLYHVAGLCLFARL
mmetsp:Transcript_28343/g.71694  ORF Transcript_28343/g.71694 Transcript_28343/m.71694 type:complete len:309 (-) Transcript_28343:349-1275(-)